MSKKNTPPVELTMVVFHKSPRARLLGETEDSEGVWLPDSQVTDVEVVGKTKGGVPLGKSRISQAPSDGAEIIQFMLPEWLAKKNGLI